MAFQVFPADGKSFICLEVEADYNAKDKVFYTKTHGTRALTYPHMLSTADIGDSWYPCIR